MTETAPAGETPQAWHPIPVPFPAEGRTCSFEIDGHRLLLCNALGEAYVLHNECPHVRVPLAGGRLQGTVLECPLHGGKLDVRDGAVVELPIRKRATCYATRVVEGQLEVALPTSA
jgi:nitrite reductase/ring-hydroxylating ferredoxin subunit